jgi:hypothetical protein
MPNLKIWEVGMYDQSGAVATLFNPFSPMSLFLGIEVSRDILFIPNAFLLVEFQIIDAKTNVAVVNEEAKVFLRAPSFGGGSVGLVRAPKPGPNVWVEMGKIDGNPADQTSASTWNLNWGQNSFFGFRGMVAAHYEYGSETPNDHGVIDALDVSPFYWFHLEPVFTL